MKEEMKLHFRAKQRAQIAERAEADSKRRLTNYIFHEVSTVVLVVNTRIINPSVSQVRVPLNTASA